MGGCYQTACAEIKDKVPHVAPLSIVPSWSLLLRAGHVEPPTRACYTPAMPIGRDEVRRIAVLARLSLTEAEEEELTEQLSHILDHFQRLGEIDTKGVEPTAHITPMEPAYREDAVRNPHEPDRWLQNAPARDGVFFKVPKIIE
jgi:aspartyl-tRNA(Asn)/glutamyl-tRNA(Gln) amidotransferase subunit C